LHMLIDQIQEHPGYSKFNKLIAVLIAEMKLTSASRNMKRRLTYLGVY
jgi:hypothetical protein